MLCKCFIFSVLVVLPAFFAMQAKPVSCWLSERCSAYLFLLQRLGGVRPGSAERLPEDGEDGYHKGHGYCRRIYPECVAYLYNGIQ